LALAPGLDSIATALGRRWCEVRYGLLGQQLETKEAEKLARRALAETQALKDPDPLEVVHWQVGLAGLLIDASRVAEAEPLIRAVLPALAETKGRNPLRLANARLQAGEMLDVLGDSEAAERWLLAGLELDRKALGSDHPEVALWEIKLGYHWSEHRRYDDAERVLRHSAKVLEAIGHYDAGSALRYLGFVEMGRERFDAAYEQFVEAERIFREVLGEDGPLQRAARISQGWALVRARRFTEAKPLLARMATETEATDGPQSLPLRSVLKYLGEVERELGQPRAALEHHRRALDIELRVFGRDEHLAIAATRYQIALDLAAMNDADSWASAAGEIATATAIVRKVDPEAPRLDDFLAASARIALRRGEAEAARRYLTEAVARYRAHDGATHPRTVAAERELVGLDKAERRLAKVRPSGPSPD
ncbi:MAG: tetratricopeptide repeat protein, partial [Thermoanaerobaculia bacterium]